MMYACILDFNQSSIDSKVISFDKHENINVRYTANANIATITVVLRVRVREKSGDNAAANPRRFCANITTLLSLTGVPLATDIPRNPFISRRRSPDAAETIRYT